MSRLDNNIQIYSRLIIVLRIPSDLSPDSSVDYVDFPRDSTFSEPARIALTAPSVSGLPVHIEFYFSSLKDNTQMDYILFLLRLSVHSRV